MGVCLIENMNMKVGIRQFLPLKSGQKEENINEDIETFGKLRGITEFNRIHKYSNLLSLNRELLIIILLAMLRQSRLSIRVSHTPAAQDTQEATYQL